MVFENYHVERKIWILYWTHNYCGLPTVSLNSIVLMQHNSSPIDIVNTLVDSMIKIPKYNSLFPGSKCIVHFKYTHDFNISS